ncbi:unnamed protein product, partial [Mesorhabditis spiculigera]
MAPRTGNHEHLEPEVPHFAPPPINIDQIIGLPNARVEIPEFRAAEELLAANRAPADRVEEAQVIVSHFVIFETRLALLRDAIDRGDPRIFFVGQDVLVAYIGEYSRVHDRAKARMMMLIATPGDHRLNRDYLRLQRSALSWMRRVRLLKEELEISIPALFG